MVNVGYTDDAQIAFTFVYTNDTYLLPIVDTSSFCNSSQRSSRAPAHPRLAASQARQTDVTWTKTNYVPVLRTLIADRAQAASHSPMRAAVRAQEISPTRPPFSRQVRPHARQRQDAHHRGDRRGDRRHVAAMQAGVAGIQARAPITFDPVSGESKIP